MGKKIQFIKVKLPPMALYIDDLTNIENILRKISDKIIFSIPGYRDSYSVAEIIEDVQEKSINNLCVKAYCSSNPDIVITLSLSAKSAYVECNDDNDATVFGVVYKIRDVLLKKKPMFCALRYPASFVYYILFIFLGSVLLSRIYSAEIAYSILLLSLVPYITLVLISPTYIKIFLKPSHIHNSFWKRHEDKIVNQSIGFIFGLITGIILMVVKSKFNL